MTEFSREDFDRWVERHEEHHHKGCVPRELYDRDLAERDREIERLNDNFSRMVWAGVSLFAAVVVNLLATLLRTIGP